jgi:short-subunit dehydrogenase
LAPKVVASSPRRDLRYAKPTITPRCPRASSRSTQITAEPSLADPRTQSVAIITGASAGIGRELALAFARADYAVVITARRSQRLEELATRIRAGGGSCMVLAGDISEPTMPQRLVDAAIASFGRIDVIANIAGMGAPGALLEQSESAVEAQWRVHVAAPLRLARAARSHLRITRGSIVFIGSGLARVPAPGFGAYALAKAAIRAAATQLRRELRDEGIAVTYVDPGAVDTEFSDAAGMERSAPRSILARPDAVARRILRGIRKRAARINAVPWQTAGVILGEWFPALADRAMARIVDRPTIRRVPEPAPQPPPAPIPLPLTPLRAEPTAFERALEPVARRMERVKLTMAFVSSLLVAGATIEFNEAAMRWAGMPNKNERAALREVFDALTTAGYLEVAGNDAWLVRRAAE